MTRIHVELYDVIYTNDFVSFGNVFIIPRMKRSIPYHINCSDAVLSKMMLLSPNSVRQFEKTIGYSYMK